MLRRIRRKSAFTWVKYFFHRLLQWFVMIAVNSEDFYYSCYSNLSPCFSGLGYCRNSSLLMAGTVDIAVTVQNSGWCWFWIVTESLLSTGSGCFSSRLCPSHTRCRDLEHLGMGRLGHGWLIPQRQWENSVLLTLAAGNELLAAGLILLALC